MFYYTCVADRSGEGSAGEHPSRNRYGLIRLNISRRAKHDGLFNLGGKCYAF